MAANRHRGDICRLVLAALYANAATLGTFAMSLVFVFVCFVVPVALNLRERKQEFIEKADQFERE